MCVRIKISTIYCCWVYDRCSQVPPHNRRLWNSTERYCYFPFLRTFKFFHLVMKLKLAKMALR